MYARGMTVREIGRQRRNRERTGVTRKDSLCAQFAARKGVDSGGDSGIQHERRAVVPFAWLSAASRGTWLVRNGLVKWLTRIIVTDTAFRGYFQTSDHTFSEQCDELPVQLLPVTEIEVKAEIARGSEPRGKGGARISGTHHSLKFSAVYYAEKAW